MKRYLLLILIALITVSCETKTLTDSDDNLISHNEVQSNHYVKDDIDISYPFFARGGSINELIKEEALKIMELFDGVRQYMLDIHYEVTYFNSKTINIKYYGEFYNEGTYPSSVFYTTNIDLESRKKIKLADSIVIDSEFIDTFRNGKLVSIDDIELEKEIRSYLSNFTNEQLIQHFSKADTMDSSNRLNVYSYLGESTLGISVGVPHALGDYAIFEISRTQSGDQEKEDRQEEEDEKSSKVVGRSDPMLPYYTG